MDSREEKWLHGVGPLAWVTDPPMCPSLGSLALFSVSSCHSVTYVLSSLAQGFWGLERNAGMSIPCEGEAERLVDLMQLTGRPSGEDLRTWIILLERK